MPSLILGAHLAKDYRSRLNRMERQVQIISWLLVLPGIIGLVLDALAKRKMKAARGLGVAMLGARRANQERKDEATAAVRLRERVLEGSQSPPGATETAAGAWSGLGYGKGG